MRGGDGGDRSRVRESFAQMGVTDEAAIEAALAEVPPDECEVWAWQWPAVRAFFAASTQWRFATVGGGMAGSRPVRTGIDYQAARAGWELLGVALTPDEFEDVRTMEIAVLRGVDSDLTE